jgi:SAM-dependent methyltransferase
MPTPSSRPAVCLHQICRYSPVLCLIHETPGETLLDVGSGSAGLAALVRPPWRVTAVDNSFDDYGGAAGPAADSVRRLLGDARDLPFEDRSFDVAVSVDMVEHLAPADRATALGELARVARRRVIVTCPVGPTNELVDRRLAAFHRGRGQQSPEWLVEHLRHALPRRAELAEALSGFGSVSVSGTSNAKMGLRLFMMESTRWGSWLSLHAGTALAGRFGDGATHGPRAAVLALLRGFDREPTSRVIAVLDCDT